MANSVVRPCASCGNPVETRRLTSTPTCSPKCYMRLRRQADKDASTMTFKIGKITITVNDIHPDADHDKLQRDIIDSLPAEMIKNAHLIELPVNTEAINTALSTQ